MPARTRGFGSVPAAFDAAAAEHPDRMLRFPRLREELSLTGLARTSTAVAGALSRAGVGPGDVVGVLGINGPAFLQSVLAAGRVGAAACPLPLPVGSGDLPAQVARMRQIAAAADVRILVHPPEIGMLAAEVAAGAGLSRMDAAAAAAAPAPASPPSAVDPGAPAVLQFTSGSTAQPKGVVLSHANVLECADAIIEAIDLGPDDAYGCWLPLFHDMGLFGTLTGLLRGIPVTVWNPADFVKDPARWLEEFLGTGATVCAMPNFAYDYLVADVPPERAERLDMRHWRVAFNGAEPVTAESVHAFLERFSPAGFRPGAMLPGYGMAEATLVATLPPVGRPPRVDWVDRAVLGHEGRAEPAEPGAAGARGVVGLGGPVPRVEVRIVPAGQDRPTADGVVGEIQLRGASVTTGYLDGRPGLFAEDGWLRTGDLGYLRSGELFFTGRSKEMITVRGLNVYPLDVEALARDVPQVHRGRSVAFAVPGEERIVLVAETAVTEPDGCSELRATIAARCRAVLGLPHLDVRLVPPRTIPRTTSGKLQRLAMRRRILAEDAR